MKNNKFLTIMMLATATSMQYASSAITKTARAAAPLVARYGQQAANSAPTGLVSSPFANQARNYITSSYFDANKKAIDSKIQEAIDKYDIFNDDNDTQNQNEIDALKQQGLQARKLTDRYMETYEDLRDAFTVKATDSEDLYSLVIPNHRQKDTSRAQHESAIQQAGKNLKQIEADGTIKVNTYTDQVKKANIKITPEMKSNIKSKLDAYKKARADVDKFLQEHPEQEVEDNSTKK